MILTGLMVPYLRYKAGPPRGQAGGRQSATPDALLTLCW